MLDNRLSSGTYASFQSDSPSAANKPAAKKTHLPHRIVIVGGGAGGLELATQLGNTLGAKGRAQIILVDRQATHLWKPLLHEVAAGSIDANTNQLEYVAQARWHHFVFQQGELMDIDRLQKAILVAPVLDEEGVEILPERAIEYDTLVLAIGSVTNFFGVEGAAEHAIAVDTVNQAERFRHRLIAACMRSQNHLGEYANQEHRQVNIVIIGGGATGVELSAELRNTAQVLGAYGLHHLDPRHDIRITLIETGPRILGPLPERVANETAKLLHGLDIEILTGERVTRVEEHSVMTAGGKSLPSDITVWAGGIQIPKVLTYIGLPVNKLGQVIVRQTLQTEIDPDIFAFGDCASCPWPEKNTKVPPRAQAAHQQAKFLYHALQRRLSGQAIPNFRYHDQGSLISLSRFNAVGNLMGKLIGRSVLIEGKIARLLYVSLYRTHLIALNGVVRTALDTIAMWLRQKNAPRVKLH
ncbi:MAG TPA: NAD(P)/FAD-dependent oxidoreductase [Burkholderiaceae bacterium]